MTPEIWITLVVEDLVPPSKVMLHEVPAGRPVSLNVTVQEPA